MRREIAVTVALATVFAVSVPALRADDQGTGQQRIAALVSELKKPELFRAVYKLVDAGPAAVPELVARLGASPLADERIETCLREIARTKEGAKAEIDRLGQIGKPLARARLARALAAAGAAEAIYPIVDALDDVQEPLDVATFGPQGDKPRETTRVTRPVSAAAASFGERAAVAIRKRLAKTTSSVYFRSEAAWVLGAVRSTASVPDLMAMAQDDKRTSEERIAALAALAQIRSPAARDGFNVALAADDASLRRAGARGLTAVPDPSALPQLAKLLEEDKDDEIRLECVRALTALEDPLAAAPLKAALERAPNASESMRVPLAVGCVSGLIASGERSATASIVQALDLGLGFTVEHAAARALAKIPDLGLEPRERLRAMVEEKKTATVPRACAAWVLAQRGEDGPLAALLESAKSKEWTIRASTASLLAEGKLDGAVPALEALAKDEHVSVRRAAVIALGRSEASIAGAALVRTARHQDADPMVRRLYAEAFVDALTEGTLDQDQQRLARAQLLEALERDTKDATIAERRAFAYSLAKLNDRPALLRVATGALAAAALPLDSRRASIEMLARMGKNDATESSLGSILADPGVGDDAALALAKIRGETFLAPSWRALLAPPIPYR
jgi:HEAT repeat protein